MSRAEREGTYIAAEEMVPPLIMFVAIVVLLIFLWQALQKLKDLADPWKFLSDLMAALKRLLSNLLSDLPNIGDLLSLRGLLDLLAQLNGALSLFARDVHFGWKLNTGEISGGSGDDSSGGSGTAQIQTGIEV